MYNSIIIDKTIKFLILVKDYFDNSIFNKIFMKIDNYLRTIVLNSLIVRTIVSPNKSAFVVNSFSHNIFSKLLIIIRASFPFIRGLISSSYIINIGKELIEKTSKYPLRITAIFFISFIISNIIFSLVTKSASIISVIVQLLFVLILFPFMKFNISAKKLLMESYFYNLFKWLIS